LLLDPVTVLVRGPVELVDFAVERDRIDSCALDVQCDERLDQLQARGAEPVAG
jgi:hypothetical protein